MGGDHARTPPLRPMTERRTSISGLLCYAIRTLYRREVMKDARLEFRISTELKESLRQMADKNCRSMGQQLEYLIMQEERREATAIRQANDRAA